MAKMVHHDCEIGLPGGWRDVSNVILIGTPKDDFCPNITMTREYLDAEGTPEQYAATQLESLEAELKADGYTVQQEGPVEIQKRPAFQRIHTFAMGQSEVKLRQWQVYFVKGKLAITITSTDKEASFDKSFPIFQAAVKEFRFL